MPWDSLVPRGCTLTMLPCIFEQPAWTRSVADEDTSALLHACELRNCDFCNQYCRLGGLRSPSKSPVMRQVHGLAGRLSLPIRVQINGVRGCHRHGCKQDPKYQSTVFQPKKERQRNERESSPPTNINLCLVHNRARAAGWPCRWEHNAHVCRAFVCSGFTSPWVS